MQKKNLIDVFVALVVVGAFAAASCDKREPGREGERVAAVAEEAPAVAADTPATFPLRYIDVHKQPDNAAGRILRNRYKQAYGRCPLEISDTMPNADTVARAWIRERNTGEGENPYAGSSGALGYYTGCLDGLRAAPPQVE